MRLIILINRPKTKNPFLAIWPRVLWLWHKIRGREVYFSKPARVEINDSGEVEFVKTIEIAGNLKSQIGANDIVRLINGAKGWTS